MKEDLGFEGNQLVELQTMYTVGAVVGQLPFMFLFTYVPMYYVIPFLDVCWGIFTLLQCKGPHKSLSRPSIDISECNN